MSETATGAGNPVGEVEMGTVYKVEVKVKDRYALDSKTSRRAEAVRRSQDLAECGYDGRIVTEKGHVTQEWTINR